MDIAEAVVSRRSIRAFREKPVPLDQLRRVLERARMAPSGCNYQPWEAVVLTGAPLKALQDVLIASAPDDPLEYRFDAPAREETYRARYNELGQAMYAAIEVGRGERDARAEFVRQNLVSFGAPVLLLCHFPKFMEGAQWSDVGMWLQTIMLLLRGEGLDSCPQEWMGVYGRTIKTHLGLGEDTLLFCGIAIGHRDETAAINRFERGRVPLDQNIRFNGF